MLKNTNTEKTNTSVRKWESVHPTRDATHSKIMPTSKLSKLLPKMPYLAQ